MAENFSSSDPGVNVPHMHGSVDSGGGLVSFLNVSENLVLKKKTFCFFLLFIFLSLSFYYSFYFVGVLLIIINVICGIFFFSWCFIHNC